VLRPIAAAAAVLLAPAPAFRFADARIAEASGLALGLRSPGIAYVQNDSGDTNRFFAVDVRTGATAATVTVRGATNVDWEDLAVARDAAGKSWVWLADTGDNDANRREVRVYRVPEPHVRRTDRDRDIAGARAAVWRLRYPGGPVDAEGLAVAPGGAAYVVTKSLLGRSTVYRLPAHPDPRHVQRLRRVGTITLAPHGVANPFGIAGELAVTGAAISPDGTRFAIRTYAEAYVWRLGPGGVAAALRQVPAFVPLPRQPQGEGIALPDDRHAWVDGEGEHAAAFRVRLPALAPAPPANSSPPPVQSATSPAPTPASSSAPAHRTARWSWVLGGAAVAAVLALGAWRFGRSSGRRTGR
jgi:hypothetical protein